VENPVDIPEELAGLTQPIDTLELLPGNPRIGNVDAVASSLKRFGQRKPIVARRDTRTVIAGNHTLQAARQLGWSEIAVVFTDDDDATASAFALADNRTADLGTYDDQLLADLIREVGELDAALLADTGWDDEAVDNLLKDVDNSVGGGGGIPVAEARASLAERFGVPPFSVLDARQGYWQDRKRAWLNLGIKSEVGRGENLMGYGGGMQLGEKDTSIFDPVLCEVAYRWFVPPHGRILDPFAGGSVRGVVAGFLGHCYRGIELRAEQVEANREQAETIIPEKGTDAGWARWDQGDSAEVLASDDSTYDLVFSCPPYFDLERYGDDDKDLSNAGSYDEFITAYREIIRLSVDRLADDRFACFVVGDIRDDKGYYRGFVADTFGAFEDAGARLHNDAILLTALSTVPPRAGRLFPISRKLAKAHQNVLVFVKGDPAKAVEACGPVEVPDLAEMFGEPLDA
jgi:DNA modification methylase